MSFLGLLSGLAGFVKVRYLVDKAIIDNIVFRCHYRVTSAILFLCCIIVTANNLIGEPINCINDGAVSTHVINTFCWITYTFTLPHQQGQRTRITNIVHPGLGNYVEEEDAPRYHSYYQWVPFMLFFQGILFYLPHWIWKNWEEGKVRMISDGMRGVVIGPKENRVGKVVRLVQYIEDTLHMHNFYAAGYFLCEALNFANVVGNIFFVDLFLGGAFLTYGTDVIKFSGLNQENRTDPMVKVFPRMTKCTFHKFGSSGSIQSHDALCVLALNILNEKIFIFLWFWFIILAVISGLALLYSSALVVLPSVRELVLKWHFRLGTPAGVNVITRKTQIGDFLLLHLLSQNMNMMVYAEVLNELCNKLYSERSNSDIPTAPSTMELSPIYASSKLNKLGRETET